MMDEADHRFEKDMPVHGFFRSARLACMQKTVKAKLASRRMTIGLLDQGPCSVTWAVGGDVGGVLAEISAGYGYYLISSTKKRF